ncbi:hypothetical protein CR513_36840, partial [Mucuna pruriens]
MHNYFLDSPFFRLLLIPIIMANTSLDVFILSIYHWLNVTSLGHNPYNVHSWVIVLHTRILGNKQEYEINCDETFAPITKMTNIILVLSIITFRGDHPIRWIERMPSFMAI